MRPASGPIRILGISGSRVPGGNVDAYLRAALDRAGGDGVEVETVALAGLQIGPCTHCNWCLRKQTEERFCAVEDGMMELYPKILAADGLILASPVHFGRLSGTLADCLDRMRAFVHGNRYKDGLADKVGGALAVAYCRGAGVETTLLSIDMFFLTMRMIVATSGLSQLGAGAYSSREGNGRFEREPRHMVLEDEPGLEAARGLADRVLELARLIRAGRAAVDG